MGARRAHLVLTNDFWQVGGCKVTVSNKKASIFKSTTCFFDASTSMTSWLHRMLLARPWLKTKVQYIPTRV